MKFRQEGSKSHTQLSRLLKLGVKKATLNVSQYNFLTNCGTLCANSGLMSVGFPSLAWLFFMNPSVEDSAMLSLVANPCVDSRHGESF